MPSAREIVDQAGGLATASGLVEILKLSRTRIYVLTEKPGFPEPVRIVGGANVWSVQEVLRWYEEYRARPPRRGPRPGIQERRRLPKGVVI